MNYQNLLNNLSSVLSGEIIAIDGPAGSGKTTLSKQLATDLSNTEIIHIDDLMPIGDDASNLSKALKSKSTTQGIFNFHFKIDDNTFNLSLHINSPLNQFFTIISKS